MERIQDYILNEMKEEEKPAAKKKPTDVSYEIVAKTNSDVVIKRKTSRTERIMAIIPSKDQYYITENGETSALTVESMNRFLDKIDDHITVDLDWIDDLERGKQNCENVLRFLRTYREQALMGIADITLMSHYRHNDLIDIYEISPKLALFLRDKKKNVVKRSPMCHRYNTYQPYACGSFDEATDKLVYLCIMQYVFGLDKTRAYIDAMIEHDVNFSCPSYAFERLVQEFYQIEDINNRYHRNFISKESMEKYRIKAGNCDVRIDPDTFIEYCIGYQEEGYNDLRAFFQELTDDWKMQRNVYGKIRDRYPKNLASHHNRIMMKQNLISEDIDAKKIERYYEKHKSYEWKSDRYIIKVPSTMGDIVDEAQQQSNCLRSYLGDVADGKTEIYFLRKRKDPESSLVTVEVKNHQLVQVKAKFNRAPNNDQKQALAEWAKAKNLVYAG